MTERQIELARHALGLTRSRLRSYRNHFTAGPGHSDFTDWIVMVIKGLAVMRGTKTLPPGDLLFHLTRAGAKRALLPGDVLDPEDWP